MIAHQVVSGASPQSHIANLISPRVGKGQPGDGYGRQFDLPREVKGPSQSENGIVTEWAGIDREHQLTAAEARNTLRMENKRIRWLTTNSRQDGCRVEADRLPKEPGMQVRQILEPAGHLPHASALPVTGRPYQQANRILS